MLNQIRGLHHVTALASDPAANNRFFTDTLGLRRVKKTVNFDHPSVYHLYFGDSVGTPGGVMTYFPFPQKARGAKGTGEVGATRFSVPPGALDFWTPRLADLGVPNLSPSELFGAKQLCFDGPDGEGLALVEQEDPRAPWTGGEVPEDAAIRGFHSVSLRLADTAATAALLRFMGYDDIGRDGSVTRFQCTGTANTVDLDLRADTPAAQQGAGSVHHIAFSVKNRAAQDAVRTALLDEGYQVTGVRDRTYFWAIYFRSPGGVLFEVATNEPGFDVDESIEHLGKDLKLPEQHEHLRAELERGLEPI